MSKLVKPIKTHGGKDDLAVRFIGLMPPRALKPNKPDDSGWLHYCEPYFGGGSVLLALDPEGISEVVGDTNMQVTNFWRVLQDPGLFGQFKLKQSLVPFSDVEWGDAVRRLSIAAGPDVSAAVAFFTRARLSLAGRLDTPERPAAFTGVTRKRTRRGMNAEVSAYLSAIDGLDLVANRMMRVLVRTCPALQLIKSEDGPRTFFYLDPPYLHGTRATVGEYGEHEMSVADHQELLEALVGLKGRFMLSGYRSALYDDFALRHSWRRIDFDMPNNAAGGAGKRRMVESVWLNY